MTPMRRVVAVALLPLLLVLSIACGDDDSDATDVSTAVSDVAGSQSDLCDAITNLETAVGNAGDLDSSSTVDEAEDVQGEISDAAEEVRNAASGVAADRLTALQTAQDAFDDAIDNLSGDQTLGDAATDLTAEASQIDDALSGLKSESGC